MKKPSIYQKTNDRGSSPALAMIAVHSHHIFLVLCNNKSLTFQILVHFPANLPQRAQRRGEVISPLVLDHIIIEKLVIVLARTDIDNHKIVAVLLVQKLRDVLDGVAVCRLEA